MIYVLYEGDVSWTSPLFVLSGPNCDLEVVKQEWTDSQIGPEPKLEKPIPWQAAWSHDNKLAPPEYQKLWKDLEKYQEARRTKCTVALFVKYLSTKGFNTLAFKANDVFPLYIEEEL